MTTPTEARWLDYAWRVATCGPAHRARCELQGGASARPGEEGNELRWPGYIGRDYQEGTGVLCVGHVHGTNWNDRADSMARPRLEAALREWIASRRSDVADRTYLETVRDVFERWLPSWRRWGHFRVVLDKVGMLEAHDLSVREIAWTNLAKCRAPRGVNNERLTAFCQRDYPIEEVVEAIRPAAVLTCVKNAYEGGSIVRTWRAPSADSLVFTWDGRRGTDRAGRKLRIWAEEAASRIAERRASHHEEPARKERLNKMIPTPPDQPMLPIPPLMPDEAERERRSAAAKKAATTKRRRAAAKKAATTKRRSAAGTKAALTKRRKAAGKKAAATRRASATKTKKKPAKKSR